MNSGSNEEFEFSPKPTPQPGLYPFACSRCLQAAVYWTTNIGEPLLHLKCKACRTSASYKRVDGKKWVIQQRCSAGLFQRGNGRAI